MAMAADMPVVVAWAVAAVAIVVAVAMAVIETLDRFSEGTMLH